MTIEITKNGILIQIIQFALTGLRNWEVVLTGGRAVGTLLLPLKRVAGVATTGFLLVVVAVYCLVAVVAVYCFGTSVDGAATLAGTYFCWFAMSLATAALLSLIGLFAGACACGFTVVFAVCF